MTDFSFENTERSLYRLAFLSHFLYRGFCWLFSTLCLFELKGFWYQLQQNSVMMCSLRPQVWHPAQTRPYSSRVQRISRNSLSFQSPCNLNWLHMIHKCLQASHCILQHLAPLGGRCLFDVPLLRMLNTETLKLEFLASSFHLPQKQDIPEITWKSEVKREKVH